MLSVGSWPREGPPLTWAGQWGLHFATCWESALTNTGTRGRYRCAQKVISSEWVMIYGYFQGMRLTEDLQIQDEKTKSLDCPRAMYLRGYFVFASSRSLKGLLFINGYCLTALTKSSLSNRNRDLREVTHLHLTDRRAAMGRPGRGLFLFPQKSSLCWVKGTQGVPGKNVLGS